MSGFNMLSASWDHFQIHDRALTQAELKAITNGDDGRLEEGAGYISNGILFDESLQLGYDFHSMGTDGVVRDVSGFGHDAEMVMSETPDANGGLYPQFTGTVAVAGSEPEGDPATDPQ